MIQRCSKILFAIAVLAVIAVSLSPKVHVPPTPGADKLLHLMAYAILATLGGIGYRGRRAALLLACGLTVMGGVLELAQHIVPGRLASLADAAANGLGSLLGVGLAWALVSAVLNRIGQ